MKSKFDREWPQLKPPTPPESPLVPTSRRDSPTPPASTAEVPPAVQNDDGAAQSGSPNPDASLSGPVPRRRIPIRRVGSTSTSAAASPVDLPLAAEAPPVSAIEEAAKDETPEKGQPCVKCVVM